MLKKNKQKKVVLNTGIWIFFLETKKKFGGYRKLFYFSSSKKKWLNWKLVSSGLVLTVNVDSFLRSQITMHPISYDDFMISISIIKCVLWMTWNCNCKCLVKIHRRFLSLFESILSSILTISFDFDLKFIGPFIGWWDFFLWFFRRWRGIKNPSTIRLAASIEICIVEILQCAKNRIIKYYSCSH